MFKKLICIFTVLAGITTNVLAVPVVRKINTTNALTTVKANNAINNSKTSITTAKAAKLPTTLTKTTTPLTSANTDTSERMPFVGSIKSISTIAKPASGNIPQKPSVTEEDLTELTDRVNVLEEKAENIPNEVSSDEGTYVTDINVDGNRINVNKTRLLYAPVKTGNSETITGDAEIWIVK